MGRVRFTKLTPARRRALDVMRRSYPRSARASNKTSYATASTPAYVYWQSARWLVDEGLAVYDHATLAEPFIDLTPKGLNLAHKVWSS